MDNATAVAGASKTVTVGDFTYSREAENIVRWPSDGGQYANGRPEIVATHEVPERAWREL